MERKYYRFVFWISVVYLAVLSILVGFSLYAVLERGFTNWLLEELPNPMEVPLRIFFIYTLILLPLWGLYSLIVSGVLTWDFYRRAKGKAKNATLLTHLLLFSPLLLWTLVLFSNWLILHRELQRGDITYFIDGQLSTFSLVALPPLWWILILSLLTFPLWLRIGLPFCRGLRGISNSQLSLLKLRMIVCRGKTKGMVLGILFLVAILVVSSLNIFSEKKPSEPLRLPIHRISSALQGLEPESYMGSRYREALQYAEEYESPQFPYLIGAILRPDFGTAQNLTLTLTWVDTKSDFKALELKNDDNGEEIFVLLQHMGTKLYLRTEPGAAPLRRAIIWPVEFDLGFQSLKLRERSDHFVLEIPAKFAEDQWQVRIVNDSNSKSDWVPLLIREDVKTSGTFDNGV